MGSVRTILASLFTALGGFFLLALTAAVGFALYLATAPDSISARADADAVAKHPLVRAQPPLSSNALRVASTSMPGPLDAPAPVIDRGARVRELQKKLARAECYGGPIDGVWNDTTKDAMRTFVKRVNAELPVEAPDESLMALIGSNDTATCAAGRAAEANAALQSSKAERIAPTDDAPTLLGRPWAPAGMLTTTTTAAASPAPAVALGSSRTEVTASNDVAPTEDGAASPAPSVAHFEGGNPLPMAQPADPHPETATPSPEPPKASVKTKKNKTAKRRPAKYEDVETTISKGFSTLQQSFSSMF
ncbi:MAG TPA: hypothetical protein PKE16_05500 [Hyphomicrobium sp.]|nr:hypothetical protein [Hyphomicrobium sp.]